MEAACSRREVYRASSPIHKINQLVKGRDRPKRTRVALKLLEVADSDDSDDDLKFRFGKRR